MEFPLAPRDADEMPKLMLLAGAIVHDPAQLRVRFP
jgi:hypothetical protein